MVLQRWDRMALGTAFVIAALINGGAQTPTLAAETNLPSQGQKNREIADLASEGKRPSLILRRGREFAEDSYVHRPLSGTYRRLAHSEMFVRALEKQVADHGVTVNIDQYSPPIYMVEADAPTMRVKAGRSYQPSWSFSPLQQQWDSVPVPHGFKPSQGTDKEAIIYQPSTGLYWEFWGLELTGAAAANSSGARMPEWQAAWGGRIDDLTRNAGYFPTTVAGHKFGTAASGLALLAGLMTISEQRRGEISHAVHIALPQTRRGQWLFPAQRTDGAIASENAIPQGMVFRFPSDLDLGGISMHPYARMIARAVQKHGMVVRDTAGVVAFYAENPLAEAGPEHPYYGLGGILDCPDGKVQPACYPDGNNRLSGFPWRHLEAVDLAAKP